MSGSNKTYVYSGATDQGKWRTRNEDCYYIPDGAGPDNLLIVADGMGGYRAGNVASSQAVDVVRDMLLCDSGPRQQQTAEERIEKAILRANDVVRLHALSHEECRGMGTTMLVALLDGEEWVLGNVGDSRAYLMSRRSIRQVTVDHSLVQEMVDEGRLTREEAAVHVHRNIITRAVGTEETVGIDTFRLAMEPGDLLLLCSDGLNEHVNDREIARLLAGRGRPDRKVRSLIGLANKRGGRDNITVVLALCGEVTA